DIESHELQPIDSPYTDIQYVRCAPGRVVFRGGSSSLPASIVHLELSSMKFDVLRRAMNIELDDGYLSKPEAIEFRTTNGLTAHALFYRPANRDYRAPGDERPPLL